MPFIHICMNTLIRHTMALAVCATTLPGASLAQWPDRPVRLLVTVGPGGAADT